MFETTAILLAAGLSRRMGGHNKLLLDVGGKPMVRHVVDQYCAAIDGPVVVVLGHQSKQTAAALHGSSARTLFNPKFADGQYTSVACGLTHAPEAETLLIGLCDQPVLTGGDIRALLAAHRKADLRRISIPVQGTQRGNPIVVPSGLRTRMLQDPERPGCQKFTRSHPELVQHLPLPAPGYYADVDTPADYARYRDDFAREPT